MTVEERVYNALTGSATLVALLADGVNSIYNTRSDDAGTYPVIVFTLVSASPSLHADDELKAFETVYRISALTENGSTKALRSAIYKAMTDAGFMWEDTNKIWDADVCVLSMDFTYFDEVNGG